MDPILRRQFVHRLFTPDGSEGHPGFELTAVLPSLLTHGASLVPLAVLAYSVVQFSGYIILKPVLGKSAATRSKAGMTLSIDNSVMDRCGKLLRCTWSWYSGRFHKVIRGQDLLGLVLTIHHIAFPLYLLFCPKQGRYHTTKADLLIFMLTQLKTAFLREGIDITQLPLTMDSAYVSQELRERLHQLGFIDIIIAGKGNYVFTIDG